MAKRRGTPPIPQGDAWQRLLAELRRIRVQIQTLQAPLLLVVAAEKLESEDARASTVDALLREGARLLRDRPRARYRVELEAIIDSDTNVAADVADSIEELLVRIEAGYDEWPTSGDNIDASIQAAKKADSEFDLAVLFAGMLTIPNRINSYMEGLRHGGRLDFHESFKDELPERADRERVLEHIATSPRVIRGLIDTPHGVIYRRSDKRWVRVLAGVAPLLSLAASLGLVLLVGSLDELGITKDDYKFNDAGKLVLGYVLVLAGAVLHLVADSFKRARRDEEPKVYAFGDGVVWLQLHGLSVAALLLPVLVVAGTLRYFGAPLTADVDDWGFYVLAGYSADSLAPVIFKQLDATAAKTTQRFKKTVGVS